VADTPDNSDERPDPFSSMFGGMFGDMMKMFGGHGPIHWDTARQIAMMTSTGGTPESNVDPRTRIDFENLARIAAMHVQAGTGIGDRIDVGEMRPELVTPGQWAQRTLDDYRPLFTDLATALGAKPSDVDGDSDPMGAMFANLTSMLAPMTMGMTVGSMVGLIAKRSLGMYDLPLPRPSGSRLLLLGDNIDAFAREWELAVDDVRMWTLVRELVTHQIHGLVHIADTVNSLVRAHVAAFEPNPTALSDRLAGLESSDPSDMMESLQRILGDPELLLGAVRSPAQDRLRPRLDTILSVVIGWSDHMTDVVGARILGSPSRIAEAARRRRADGGDETSFVERLLGVHVKRSQIEAGRAFVSGVIERGGEDALSPLYRSADDLPTPAELEAPGLWLARIEYVNGD
jgi:putative hydrolase